MGRAGQRAWKDAPTPAVFDRMVELSQGRDRLLLLLLGRTGLRVGELVALTPDSLDLQDGTLHVPGTKTRFSRRVLPLKQVQPEVWNGLRSYFDLMSRIEPTTTSAVRDLVKRLARKAGAGDLYPHSLRARAAYDMARRLRGNALKLCAWMGWRSLGEADAYVRASGAVLFDTADKLDGSG